MNSEHSFELSCNMSMKKHLAIYIHPSSRQIENDYQSIIHETFSWLCMFHRTLHISSSQTPLHRHQELQTPSSVSTSQLVRPRAPSSVPFPVPVLIPRPPSSFPVPRPHSLVLRPHSPSPVLIPRPLSSFPVPSSTSHVQQRSRDHGESSWDHSSDPLCRPDRSIG